MLSPSRFYRKYKCIVDHPNESTGQFISVRKTLDLGDIADYEEYLGEKFKDGLKRIVAYYYTSKPPIYIRISYDEFDAIFEKYHAESGTLDNRSIKKKLNYSGPMKMHFNGDKHILVMNAFPKDYTFDNKTPDMIQDDMLWFHVTPMN